MSTRGRCGGPGLVPLRGGGAAAGSAPFDVQGNDLCKWATSPLACLLLLVGSAGRENGRTDVRNVIAQYRAAADAGERVIASTVSARHRSTGYRQDGTVVNDSEIDIVANGRFGFCKVTRLP